MGFQRGLPGFFVMVVFGCQLQAQTTDTRQTAHDAHLWLSINSNIRFSEKWGMMADVHHRRRDFGQSTSFNFLRLGATYWVQENLRVTAGLAFLQLAPPFSNRNATNEYRFHHEAVHTHKIHKINALERLRFDHRWREQWDAEGNFVKFQFTTRVRFLYSLSYPLFKGPGTEKKPHLVLANEVLLQMGPEIRFNFFEQNRLFLGVRQKITKNWAFDAGYMYVFQQTAFVNQLNAFHTLRLFFYWTPDFRKQQPTNGPQPFDENFIVE